MTPYSNLPPRSFWAPAVGRLSALEISDLWQPKWPITASDRVVTFGSCFAQHFAKALLARNYGWTNYEPGPAGLGPKAIETFNYNVFSARTGNIYTANILKQWVTWALGHAVPPEEVWEAEGRFFDPFRPAIEPGGFASAAELRESRDLTIRSFAQAIREADLFVFTLGLTESWRNASHGYEYALCPGTVAGRFDAAEHVFVNEKSAAVALTLSSALAAMQEVNPALRILLTVSPVPLTATASQDHVLVATTYSKSVLRAVAGEVAAASGQIDYFPSYEIITAPPYGGRFFAENRRSVLPEGVNHVMAQFFSGQSGKYGALKTAPDRARRGTGPAPDDGEADDDLVCEEALLSAFAPKV